LPPDAREEEHVYNIEDASNPSWLFEDAQRVIKPELNHFSSSEESSGAEEIRELG
jgi:hypothetical protein